MKIQLVSDLHLEFLIPVQVKELANKLSYRTRADVLVLAGDICALNKKSSGNLSHFLDVVQDRYENILYVLGNHEYYGTSYEEVHNLLEESRKYRENLYKANLTILENNSVTIEDTTFYGTTLWFEETIETNLLKYNLNDYRCIKDFTPDKWSREAIKFIKNVEDNESKKVLITHHVPHSRFISPKYVGNEMNCFYLNEIGKFLNKFNLVMFGHSHDSVNQPFSDSCRAISNPRGYPKIPNTCITYPNSSSTEGENDKFQYQLIVEV